MDSKTKNAALMLGKVESQRTLQAHYFTTSMLATLIIKISSSARSSIQAASDLKQATRSLGMKFYETSLDLGLST